MQKLPAENNYLIILCHAHFDLNYSGFLLSLFECKGDTYIASQFGSESVTTKLYSDFIDQQLEAIIRKHTTSQKNHNLFGKYVLADRHSIGDTYVQGKLFYYND